MQETELNYPGLTAQGEDALVGMVYDPLQSGQPNIVTGFQFTDGRLARILQTEGADVSRGSGFYMHYLLLHHHITTWDSLMLACDSAVIAWTDGTEETPDMENDNKDREKQARIDAGFAAGEVTIRSVFHSDSYTLTLNVLKAGEQVVYDRTYTPRPGAVTFRLSQMYIRCGDPHRSPHRSHMAVLLEILLSEYVLFPESLELFRCRFERP